MTPTLSIVHRCIASDALEYLGGSGGRVPLELLGEPSTGPSWRLSVFLSHEDILSSEVSCLWGRSKASSALNNDQTTTLLNLTSLDCAADLEPLWLQAQSVPSASLVPCVPSLPAGWRFVTISEGPRPSAARNGWSMFTLRKYLVGSLVVRLSVTCDTTGAIQQPSAQPGAQQRYERTDQGRSGRAATWYTVFPGGCVTQQLDWTSAADAAFATEARSIVAFTTRQALQQALEQRSGGRLHLDPLPD